MAVSSHALTAIILIRLWLDLGRWLGDLYLSIICNRFMGRSQSEMEARRNLNAVLRIKTAHLDPIPLVQAGHSVVRQTYRVRYDPFTLSLSKG